MDEAYATITVPVDPEQPGPAAIAQAARLIRDGELVAFPTETVYGLGADALNPQAVARIFRAKGRPADNPIIVHIPSAQDLASLTPQVPALAGVLAARFWPGPLTLVVRRAPQVPYITTGGLETVAVRVPAHPVALALLRAAQRPIAAPSANRSGRPSPTCAEHVLEDLRGRVRLVLDAGPCAVGVESTVLDVTQDPPVLLRPGGVTAEALEAVVGQVGAPRESDRAAGRSPGARYRHYAPRAALLLAPPGEVEPLAVRLLDEGRMVGIMARRPLQLRHPRARVRIISGDLAQYARELFAALRELDAQGRQVIVAESVAEQGLGLAIMDRLRRAAAGSQGSE